MGDWLTCRFLRLLELVSVVTMLAEKPQKHSSPKEKVERKRILQGQEGGTQAELCRLTAPEYKTQRSRQLLHSRTVKIACCMIDLLFISANMDNLFA